MGPKISIFGPGNQKMASRKCAFGARMGCRNDFMTKIGVGTAEIEMELYLHCSYSHWLKVVSVDFGNQKFKYST